jgi:hypothetical protein
MHHETCRKPPSRIHRPRYSKKKISPFPFFIYVSGKLMIKSKCANHRRTVEHPSIRAFALAPGQIPTRLAAVSGTLGDNGDGSVVAPDSVALPAATMLYLTSGRADWLSGRCV